MESIYQNVWIFLILQLINVILSTIKSIITIRGNKLSAVLINSIYYGYYTLIIKAVGTAETFSVFGIEVDGTLAIAVITILTNVIGVWLSLTVLERFRKDKLWLLKITVELPEVKDLKNELLKNNLKFITLSSTWKDALAIEVYLYSKDETRQVSDLLKKFNTVKYCIIETESVKI